MRGRKTSLKPLFSAVFNGKSAKNKALDNALTIVESQASVETKNSIIRFSIYDNKKIDNLNSRSAYYSYVIYKCLY